MSYLINFIHYFVKEWTVSTVALTNALSERIRVDHLVEQCLDQVLPGA